MKKYEYVSVHIGKLVGAKSEEHRQIIDEYAKKGYRYVGYIPTVISDYGKIKYESFHYRNPSALKYLRERVSKSIEIYQKVIG